MLWNTGDTAELRPLNSARDGLVSVPIRAIRARAGERRNATALAGRTVSPTVSLLPISLGVLVVLAVYILTRFEYCGGGVVLATAIIVPVV